MRTEDIQYLMAAVHEGSMSKAAEQQYISQQNITNAIKRLESELGLALLQRSNKGIQFTAHGKMLQPYLNQILMAVGEINAYAKGQQNDQQHQGQQGIQGGNAPLDGQTHYGSSRMI